MKKTILLSFLFVFSLFVSACNDDDDDDDNQPNTQNQEENTDPEFEAIISGALTDTISFTIDGGIQTDHSIIGSYVGVADLLNIVVMELPTGFQFTITGNRDSFGEGTYEASQQGGFGAYNNTGEGIAYLGTSCTIEITSTELLQDLVQAQYNATGTFSMTLENSSDSSQTIQIEGTFKNIPIGVNE